MDVFDQLLGLRREKRRNVLRRSTSSAAECLAAKQAGVKALFIGDAVSVVEAVASDCNAQGYDPTIIASDGVVGEGFIKTPGLEKNLLAFDPQIPFNVSDTPGTKTMLAAFKKYEPSLTSNPNYNGEVDEAWVSGSKTPAATHSSRRARAENAIRPSKRLLE
jgi:branched-chain amino acid transport system substrate-binding protein